MVNSTTVSGTSSKKVAVDTGTSLIGGPPEALAAIYAQIPGSSKSTAAAYDGYWQFPCSAQFDISLNFDGIEYPIYPLDFNLGTTGVFNGEQNCLGAFFEITGSTNGPKWIVGDTFLKSYYTVFQTSPPAIGFASIEGSSVQFMAEFVQTTSSAAAAASIQLSLITLIALFTTLISLIA